MAKKSIRKTIKRIIKLSLLIGIKEAYLLGRNLLGLIYHPFLTLRIIKKERDFSQTILIGSTALVPAILALSLAILSFFITHFIGTIPEKVKLAIEATSLFLFTLSLAAIFYLLYWSFQVIKKSSFYQNARSR